LNDIDRLGPSQIYAGAGIRPLLAAKTKEFTTEDTESTERKAIISLYELCVLCGEGFSLSSARSFKGSAYIKFNV
jgi:hypothetical protein